MRWPCPVKPRPQMICVSRFFDRASGHSVFVLSNCCVEQTPPLGQSDKCRDRLASTSLSKLLNPPPLPRHPLPGPTPTVQLPAHPALALYLKLTCRERCPGLVKVSVVSRYGYSPNLRNQDSETTSKVLFLAGFI